MEEIDAFEYQMSQKQELYFKKLLQIDSIDYQFMIDLSCILSRVIDAVQEKPTGANMQLGDVINHTKVIREGDI